MASTGDAQDFGDLTKVGYNRGAVCYSKRGVFGGGQPDNTTTMEFVQIATTGNSQDFGDLSQAHEQAASVSNTHGGL